MGAASIAASGLASFIEVTNPSAAFYGVGGARISSQDGATLRLDATGAVFVHSGVTEQGQGAEAVLAQCVATSFGVPIERVRVVTGDTDHTPYGGGTWASRAAGIGGEAAWQAGKALRANVLAAAGAMLQADPATLDISGGIVVDAGSGRERLPLEEVARVVYFRPDTLPPGFQAEFVVTRHYVPRGWPFAFTNGVQGSYLEVDVTTGEVKLLKHWCVEDCGTVINPQLVDEQIRGGIVQGIGGALYEHCVYDEAGQLINGNMMDYLVPMAVEMPDIEVGHVVTPTADSELGAKGAGEAGTAGAPACIMNAINDALRPLRAAPLLAMPFTPERVLRALGNLSPFPSAPGSSRVGALEVSTRNIRFDWGEEAVGWGSRGSSRSSTHAPPPDPLSPSSTRRRERCPRPPNRPQETLEILGAPKETMDMAGGKSAGGKARRGTSSRHIERAKVRARAS